MNTEMTNQKSEDSSRQIKSSKNKEKTSSRWHSYAYKQWNKKRMIFITSSKMRGAITKKKNKPCLRNKRGNRWSELLLLERPRVVRAMDWSKNQLSKVKSPLNSLINTLQDLNNMPKTGLAMMLKYQIQSKANSWKSEMTRNRKRDPKDGNRNRRTNRAGL